MSVLRQSIKVPSSQLRSDNHGHKIPGLCNFLISDGIAKFIGVKNIGLLAFSVLEWNKRVGSA